MYIPLYTYSFNTLSYPKTLKWVKIANFGTGSDIDVGQTPSGSSWLDIDQNEFNFSFTIIVAKH